MFQTVLGSHVIGLLHMTSVCGHVTTTRLRRKESTEEIRDKFLEVSMISQAKAAYEDAKSDILAAQQCR